MRFMHCNTILFINRNNKISYECLCVKMQGISIQKLLSDLIRLLKILWCTTSLNSMKKNIRNHAYEIALKRQTEFVLIDIICHWTRMKIIRSLWQIYWYQYAIIFHKVFFIFYPEAIANWDLNYLLIWVGCKVVGFYILYVGRLMTQQ